MDRSRAATALLALTLAACGGGDGGTGPSGGGQTYTLGVAVGSNTVSVAAGGSTTVTVTISRGGGLPGDVTLQLEGVPTGVAIAFAPQALSGSVTSSTMTITVDRTAAPGRYLMTVRATSQRVDEVGAQIWLDITAAPDYSLKAARDTLTVVQGGSGQLDVGLTRTGGFSGAVTLSLGSVPGGATATFAPNPVTADRSTLTLSVPASVPPGKSTVTVGGAAEGLPERTTTFVLDVVDASAPGFTLSVTPMALTAVTGGAGVSATVRVRRTGGFTGAVSLESRGQPAGLTWSCTPNPVRDSVATITYVAAVNATGGTYTVSLVGTATGYPTRQVDLQLTVQETPGFWVTLSSSSITSAPGAAPQTVNVQITRTGGFADTVHLSMTDLPVSIGATLNPAATLANATLTIAVGSKVDPGTYTGTLHATATGQLERTTRLTVVVQSSSTDIVWRFCSPVPSPVFVAVQDGVSPYAGVTAAGDGSFTTSLASGKGAVVLVVPGLPDTATAAPGHVAGRRPDVARITATGSGYTTYMYYGTVSDLQQVAAAQCPASGAPRTLHGSVAGIHAGDAWAVGMGGASAIGMPGAAASFTLANVLAGTRDLVAARAPAQDNQTLADAIVLRRALNPADGATLPVIDFGAAEAFAPATGTLNVSAIPSGASTEVVLGFTTASGTSAFLGQLDAVTTASRLIPVMPTARLQAGDLHTVTATAENASVELVATLYAGQVGSWALAFGTPPQAPTADVYATTPLVRLRTRGSFGPVGEAYGAMVHATFAQPTAQRATVVYQSRNYVGSTGSFEIRTGGYNTLAGWNEATYGFQTGAPARWTVELLSAGYLSTPADGTVLQTMRAIGSLTP